MTETTGYEALADELSALQNTDGSADSKLTFLAREMFERERTVAEAAETLRKAQDHLNDIKERELPKLMQTLCIPNFNFTDPHTGRQWKVKVVDTCYASIPKDTPPDLRAKGLDWVRGLGQGGSISKDYIIAIGLADAATVTAVREAVAAVAPMLSTKTEEKINAQTLSAIVRRQIVDGKPIPEGIKVTPKYEAACSEKK